MKKVFLMMIAAMAMTMVSCGGTANGGDGNDSTATREQAAAPAGNVYDGDKFTMSLPDNFKETSKGESYVNAEDSQNDMVLDATFSDYPCKPADFQTYYNNFTGMEMNKDSKFEEAKIDGNILTFKGVGQVYATTNFVVFIDDQAGVAGKVRYPIEKAGDIEAKIMPMLKSIKKK